MHQHTVDNDWSGWEICYRGDCEDELVREEFEPWQHAYFVPEAALAAAVEIAKSCECGDYSDYGNGWDAGVDSVVKALQDWMAKL